MLLDIYNFIHTLEEKIGNDCRVMLFIAFDGTLSIQINYMEDLQYRKTYTKTELEYMDIDENHLLSYLAFVAKNFYKTSTIGVGTNANVSI